LDRFRDRFRRARLPLAIYAVSAVIYVLFLGDRMGRPGPGNPAVDNHFVYLAESFLAGQLGLVENRPPGSNDWACYDTVDHGPCPANRHQFPEHLQDRYKWYVSFPPLPAVVILPVVAVMGQDTPDALFWALLGGLGPALLFVLLRFLSESGRTQRSTRDNVAITTLFAFGSVYFFTVVQGTVWFSAHVVAVPLLVLYVLFSLDARRPALAGLMLGLAFMTRPTTAFLVVFFVIEAMALTRGSDALLVDPEKGLLRRLHQWLSGVRFMDLVKPFAMFAAPILVIGGIAMWMNEARFEDPFEFGHRYLQIRWRPRIERWGLFNYHSLGKNLAVFLAALPWLTANEPFLKISRHGLALWVTTPQLIAGLFPKKTTTTMVAMFVSAGIVALLNLCYQNSGWVQFGYRFSLDYAVFLFALLAMNGRRLGTGFYLLLIWAIAINTFGAITFDRAGMFYDGDPTQNVIFQPD
jgi:hypothetical protein